jgi:hypothetical protein
MTPFCLPPSSHLSLLRKEFHWRRGWWYSKPTLVLHSSFLWSMSGYTKRLLLEKVITININVNKMARRLEGKIWNYVGDRNLEGLCPWEFLPWLRYKLANQSTRRSTGHEATWNQATSLVIMRLRQKKSMYSILRIAGGGGRKMGCTE